MKSLASYTLQQSTTMLALPKIMVWLLAVAGCATALNQATNNDNPLSQAFSSPQVIEFQKLSAEWTAGVVDAFKKHGATLKELTDTEYVLIPTILREQAEKEHAKFYKIKWEDLPIIIKDWIKANPRQTAFHVVNGVVFFAPAAASGPILWILGFTPVGPRLGK